VFESSVHAIESSVHAIESAIHLVSQVTNVGADLADRCGVFFAAAFQVRDTLLQSSHSRASFPGRHGPILHRRHEHDVCPAVNG
jgi:hypothetical protein